MNTDRNITASQIFLYLLVVEGRIRKTTTKERKKKAYKPTPGQGRFGITIPWLISTENECNTLQK